MSDGITGFFVASREGPYDFNLDARPDQTIQGDQTHPPLRVETVSIKRGEIKMQALGLKDDKGQKYAVVRFVFVDDENNEFELWREGMKHDKRLDNIEPDKPVTDKCPGCLRKVEPGEETFIEGDSRPYHTLCAMEEKQCQ